jgi:hypothetical protein
MVQLDSAGHLNFPSGNHTPPTLFPEAKMKETQLENNTDSKAADKKYYGSDHLLKTHYCTLVHGRIHEDEGFYIFSE